MSFEINGKTYPLNRLSVLRKFTQEMLHLEPYPHIIIKNCLDEEIYEHLSKHYPSDAVIAGSKQNENTRYQLNVKTTKNKDDKEVIPLWKLFVKYHTSKEFYKEVENVFGRNTLKTFPNLKNKKKEYDALKIKEREIDMKMNEKHDIVLDCQIGINTPTTHKFAVKGPHIDNLNEVYAGLLYFKDNRDIGEGGNLEIYKTKKSYNNLKQFRKLIKPLPNKKTTKYGVPYTRKQEFDPKLIECVSRVPYEKNTFVMFLNQENAIHGVSEREINPISRKLVNIIGECYYQGNALHKRCPEWK